MQLKLTVLLAVLVALLGGTAAYSQDGDGDHSASDAPYILYYSDSLNAFVVERADGTDSHLVAQGLMDERTTSFPIVEWSPNGEWLIWKNTGPNNIEGEGLERTWGLNVSSGTYLAALDDLADVRYIEWSSDSAYLLVAATDRYPYWDSQKRYEYVEYVFTVIDVANDSVTAKFRGRTSFIPHEYPLARWLPGGRQVVFHHYFPNPMTGQTIAKVVDAETGNIQRLVEPAVALSVPNGYPATSGAWLGYHLPESAEVMLVNLLSGERQALPVDADRVDAIHWYPDGERALVYLEKGDCSRLACERDVWYFSRPDNAFEQVLAGGEAVDTPGALNQFSPDGQRTLLLSENYQIYLFDAPELEPLFEDDVPLSLKVQRWNWHDESTVLLSGHPSDKGLLLDLAADTYQVLGEGGPHYLSFNSTELSSSGRYIVWPGPFDIIDRQTGSRVSISPHPGLSEGRLPADYGHWHPDEPWVIMAANNAVAGGGVGRKLMSVANADGTIVRHFDHSCWFFLNCLQWLPASVDVERLP